MPVHVIGREDGRADGEAWEAEFIGKPYGAGISILLVSYDRAGYGPRLHRHPYPETFVIRCGSARFTIDGDELMGTAGQIIVVPAFTLDPPTLIRG